MWLLNCSMVGSPFSDPPKGGQRCKVKLCFCKVKLCFCKTGLSQLFQPTPRSAQRVFSILSELTSRP